MCSAAEVELKNVCCGVLVCSAVEVKFKNVCRGVLVCWAGKWNLKMFVVAYLCVEQGSGI